LEGQGGVLLGETWCGRGKLCSLYWMEAKVQCELVMAVVAVRVKVAEANKVTQDIEIEGV